MTNHRPLLRASLAALAALGGCAKDPVVEVIPGVNTSVEVVLVNPTECPVCDPFADIDTLRLEVSVGGDVVASDNFAYPGEAVTLPDLTGFGVVRFTLLGLADGRVLSAGRTAEVVLLPDAEQSVPLVFVPANRALPLANQMVTERYRPGVVARRDGSVLIVGGLDPLRERATAVTEVYDPATGLFTEGPPLPMGLAAPVVAPLPEGARLLAGGFAVVGGNEMPVEDTTLFDEATFTFTASGDLSFPRADHCVAMFRERQGLALGGADGFADYLKPDSETGAWTASNLDIRDLDEASVTDCAVAAEGVVFVQGRDAGSTGVWNEASADEPAEAFRPINAGGAGDARYVEGPALLPMGDGTVRILGGADVATGEVLADGRLFSTDARRFTTIPAFSAPRFDPQVAPWVEAGWYVAGCGWADADRATDEPTIELFAPAEGLAGPLLPLDRDRPGCALGVLPDGSILVAGGGPEGVPEGAAAALLVPWMDLAEGG